SPATHPSPFSSCYPMRQPATPPHLITLILLAGFSPMSLNMFMPSLANIARDLSTDYATVSWSVSGYLAVTAIVQLIIGPLSDRIGRRPVILVVAVVFAGASVGCALASGVGSFLFFRMLQGGISAGFTLSMAIVRDTHTERQAVSLIGYIGMSMALAPMLGPVVGGVLDTLIGWRSIFVFYATAGVLLLLLCWFDLGETKVRNGLAAEGPTTAMRVLLSEPRFWAYSLCGAFSVGAFFIFITGAPLVAVAEFGVSTAELGFYIGTITAGFMAGSFIAGRYGAKYPITTMMVAGRVVSCVGMVLGLLLLGTNLHSPVLYFSCVVFVGFGNGVTMPASNTGAMSVRPDLAGSAAGLNGALIVAGGALLTALTGNIITETHGAQTLLVLMLAVSGIGLCLALWASRLSRVVPTEPASEQ
ncbi:MAG: multidrug effflux MFS transporter, partial [Pseudomonadota bacterium]